MLQRPLSAGFIEPCLPTKTDKLPSGDLWLHEIKHDGFRVIARKDGERVRLYSRPGLASFERIRYRQHDGDVFLYAFDLIELNGDDLRRDPLQVRKATLASILSKASPGIRFNEHNRRRWPDLFRPCLQDGTRRHRIEAEGLGLPFGTLAALAQDEKPGARGGEAGGG